MKYQAKVTNTQKHEDSQGSHIVTTGKLLVLKKEESPLKLGYFTPYIISETEEIEVGDKFYYLNYKYEPTIKEKTEENQRGLYSGNKVLALPEHFSDKHLQAIVGGKMKDGDTVLVKYRSINTRDGYTQPIRHSHYVIDLDQQNHITLFPAKLSLEQAYYDYFGIKVEHSTSTHDAHEIVEFAKWAKKNNY